jgi:hypothetical protein
MAKGIKKIARPTISPRKLNHKPSKPCITVYDIIPQIIAGKVKKLGILFLVKSKYKAAPIRAISTKSLIEKYFKSKLKFPSGYSLIFTI